MKGVGRSVIVIRAVGVYLTTLSNAPFRDAIGILGNPHRRESCLLFPSSCERRQHWNFEEAVCI